MEEENKLHRAFAMSEYGQTLADNSRFRDFKPEWASNALWWDILGDDVNNLAHMPHTLKITNIFVDELGITQPDADKLRVTAITHDWGEAIVGDTPHPDKTVAGEKKERIAYRQIASELLGEAATRLTGVVLPILDKEGDLGDMFRCIEYIGYYCTANLAGVEGTAIAHGIRDLRTLARPKREELSGRLLGLSKAVEASNYGILAQYVKEQPKVSKVIPRARMLWA